MKNPVEAKLAYRENAVRGATPIELVVILFDAALDDMRRALTATNASDIEQRGAAIGHAMLILQQLQGTLDFEKGGEVARQFEEFYNLIRAKLLESQLRNSPELMQKQIQFMSEVRNCWAEADKHLKLKPAAPAPREAAPQGGGPKAEWSA